MKKLNLKNLKDQYQELDDAEREKMVQKIKSAVKRKNNHITEMMGIVEKTVQHFKNDFYIYDVELISLHPDTSFIWLVRDSGTHWINAEADLILTDGESRNLSYFHSIINTNRTKGIYYFNKSDHSFQKIKQQTAEIILQAQFERMAA